VQKGLTIMTSQSERDEYYHNKGQTDASNNKFDPPHNFDIAFDPLLDDDAAIEENQHYRDGYHHTKSQQK